MIVQVSAALRRTARDDIDRRFKNLSGSHHQTQNDDLTCLTLMMTPAQVVETSVNVTANSPSQDHTHPLNHDLPTYDMTPGFKPFSIF